VFFESGLNAPPNNLEKSLVSKLLYFSRISNGSPLKSFVPEDFLFPHKKSGRTIIRPFPENKTNE
jgi:hypothetical protein